MTNTIKRLPLLATALLAVLLSHLLVGGIAASAAEDSYTFDEAAGTLTFYIDAAVFTWDGTAVSAENIVTLVFGKNVTVIPARHFQELPALIEVRFLGDNTIGASIWRRLRRLPARCPFAAAFRSCPITRSARTNTASWGASTPASACPSRLPSRSRRGAQRSPPSSADTRGCSSSSDGGRRARGRAFPDAFW